MLRQAIFDGDLTRASKFYRRAFPNVLEHEAGDFVARLDSELRSKQPEKFASPPKWWELNWRAVKICLMIEVCALAGIWLFVPTIIEAHWAMKLLCFSLGFVAGAGFLLPLRIKVLWKQVSVLFMCLLPTILAPFVFKAAYFNYLEGAVFGACMVIAGFT